MKTSILSILFVVSVCFTCLGQYTPITPYIYPDFDFNNLNYNCGSVPHPPQYCTAPDRLIAPSTPTDPDNINCDAQVIFWAGTEIDLNPGFHAGPFTTGSFVTQFLPSLNPVITVWGLQTYDECEFGIQLPPNIQTSVDAFLNNPDNPPAGSINPYDPKQILIAVTFTSPSNNTYTRYGFYYQDVAPISNPISYYPPNPQFTASGDAYPFRVRFAPPEAGNWIITIVPFYFPNGIQTIFGNIFYGTYNVARNSGKPGNVVKGNNWHFKFDNPQSSKVTFFPVGQNIAWANPSFTEQPLSNNWFAYECQTDNDFNTQRNYLNDIETNGGNFARIVMTEWSNGIENETPVNCNSMPYYGPNAVPIPGVYNQSAAWELDKTINTCEGANIYALLSLTDDIDLSFNPVGAWWLGWNAINPNPPYNCENPYYNYLSAKNGPNPPLQSFFTDPGAIQYFKNKLFYIEARWGYSTNVAIFEINGETNTIGASSSYPNGGGPDMYGGNSAFQTSVANWVATMYHYLHGSDYSFYPIHLVTTGYAEGPSSPHSSAGGNDYSPEFIDLFESHHYTDVTSYSDIAGSGGRFAYYYGSDMNRVVPFLYGEMGTDIANQNCSAIDQCSDKAWHNFAWTGALTTSGTGLNWDDENQVNSINHRNNFNFLASVFGQVDFERNQFYILPQYEVNFPTEVMYLQDVSGGQNYHLGWVHDLYDSWANDVYGNTCSDALPCVAIPGTQPYDPPITPSIVFDNLLPFTYYNLTMYNTNISLGGTIYFNQYSAFGSFTFNQYFNSLQPDFAFLVDDGSFQSGTAYAKPVRRQNNNDTITLPNDTVYLSFDSLHYPGNNHLQGHYLWDFGNGQSSTLLNPAWKYDFIGNYPLTLNYSDLADSVHHYIKQTYVVLDTAKHFTIQDSNLTFKLLPNPTTGVFAIYSKFNDPIMYIEITNVLGKLCYREDFPKGNSFNISTFSSGIYIVHVLTEKQEYIAKVVKE